MNLALRLSIPLLGTAALAAQQEAPLGDFQLADLSLEELMNVPVEVSARQQQPLAATAAAVFVLNEPEIRRSGMRSIPEVLRLVPGLIVAQDVPGAYGFSSRIGEHEFAGMLVLIDGQRLYGTLLRREYWQAIDLPLAIVERIEVIRGPGGSRWGDKASQGVINIVTKKAAAGRGVFVTGWAGSEERLGGTFRVGDALGPDTDFYLFGKAKQVDGGHPSTSGDRWDNNNVGGRLEHRFAPDVQLVVDGLYHDSFLGDSFEIDPGFSSLNMIKGGHVKAKLRIDHDGDAWTEWRFGLDAYDQDIRDYRDDVPEAHLRFREEFFDTALVHSRPLAEDHRVTIGAVLRSLTVERFETFLGDGAEYNETRGDLFAAWDWDVSPNVRLTLGGNFGYQDTIDGSGVDTQPDLRLAWRPDPDVTLWAAVSTNREPDRKIADSGLLVRRASSRLLAYELGARWRLGERLLLSADGFVYQLEDQINGFDTDPGSGATLYRAGGHTDAFGGELHATWKPAENLRVTAFVASTEANSQNFDPTFFTIEDEVPRLRGAATIGYEPLPGVELDTNVLYTQRRAGIPTWWRVDLRLGWRVSDRTAVELVGQNLTDPDHEEYFFLEGAQRGFYFLVSHRL